MTPQIKGKLIVVKEDYNLLMKYAGRNKADHQKVYASELLESLNSAEVLNREEFPEDMIRLNSRVTLRDKIARHNYVYTIVLPEDADHRSGKVSVLAPIGASLLGYRIGEDVSWQMHSGKRYFTIMGRNTALRINRITSEEPCILTCLRTQEAAASNSRLKLFAASFKQRFRQSPNLP